MLLLLERKVLVQLVPLVNMMVPHLLLVLVVVVVVVVLLVVYLLLLLLVGMVV